MMKLITNETELNIKFRAICLLLDIAAIYNLDWYNDSYLNNLFVFPLLNFNFPQKQSRVNLKLLKAKLILVTKIKTANATLKPIVI